MPKEKTNFLVSDVGGELSEVNSWGTIGLATIFCTVIASFFSFIGSNQAAIFIIVSSAIVTVALTAVFYFTPLLQENNVLSPVPDLIFIIGVTVMAINLTQQSDFLIIFLIVILAISAFSKELWAYIITFLGAIISMVTIHLLGQGMGIGFQDISIHLLSLLTFGILFRVLATETNDLRKKVTAATSRSSELLEQRKNVYLIIDNLSEGIIAVDQESNVTLINKSALKILDLSGKVESYLGKNVNAFFEPVVDGVKVSLVDSTLEGGNPEIHDDLRLVRQDQVIRLHSETRPIIDEHRKAIGAIVLFRDFTAQAELEEQRSEFLAVASHELRTPLTVIEGYLYYLTSDTSLKYDRKTKEYLGKTYQAAEDLIHLSNDILAVVRSEEGHMQVALEETALSNLVTETVAKFKDKAKKQKIKLTVEMPDNLPNIVTDRGKISEVLSNLVENALKFTEKGSVLVRVEAHGQHEITTSVIDTGVGISKSDLKNIFQKFYRTEDWQTRKTGGSGLGLYIAKTYITRLGGKIGVESKKGSGSTFWFSLPLGLDQQRNKHKQDAQLHDFISSI